MMKIVVNVVFHDLFRTIELKRNKQFYSTISNFAVVLVRK